MSKQESLVSICIPVYNCERCIKETIESIWAQTYKNIEIIIVDDGSTDNTKQILKALLYGDDVINTTMIESQMSLAADNQDCIISSKWGRFYANDLRTFKLSPEDCWQTLPAHQWLCSSWKNGQSMTQPGIFLLPREIIDNSGLWDEQLTLIDDLDFFTRVILKSKFILFDPSAVLYYRSGNKGSLSDNKKDEAILSAFMAIDKATANLLAMHATLETKLACANTWQNFVYTIYPKYPGLGANAQKKIDELGGSSLKFTAGGITKALTNVLGWKMTKRLKQAFRAIK